jgi:hypothetical protein
VSVTLSAPDEEEALDHLHALGCTDGLPVVVPTPSRVERMVLAGGVDPDLVLGDLGPNLGAATVEKVAINAVMAGCVPDVFPVVLAAVGAICDPVLDMTEVQSTTHDIAPILIVNGPAVKACGIASGFGALGPGHRANATIGRAVRLCMINIGGGRPGVSDMALLGHPGKFTYCLGEDEDASPFPPLHTSLGFRPEQSTVTVACVEAPHSVIGFLHGDDPTNADRLLTGLARALSVVTANNALSGHGVQVVVLNPDHANALAAAGHDRVSIVRVLAERAGNRWAEIAAVHGGEPSEPDRFVRSVTDPGLLLVLVAGGTGLYSTVMPSWGGGPHHNVSVTREVVLDQACDLPWATPSEAGSV